MSLPHAERQNASFVAPAGTQIEILITLRMGKMSSSRMQFLRSALVAALLPVSLVHAQARVASMDHAAGTRPLEAVRVNVPIRIDGRLDEPVWRAVHPTSPFVQREPMAGAPETHLTDVRMLITDDAVIIGARLRDDHDALFTPVKLAGAGEGVGYLNDFFEVQIDPHRDHATAFALAVSPGGVRRSSLITADGFRDESWDVKWDAATATDADGWTVEIRIPLSEFHVKPGAESWGVQFVRFSSRRQETDVYNYVTSRAVSSLNDGRQQR